MTKTKNTSGAIGAGISKRVKKIESEGIMRNGFGILPKYVMRDKDMTLEAKAVYAYFCSYIGNGSTCYPKRNTILSQLGEGEKNWNIKTYYNHFNQLIEQGYVAPHRQKQFPYNNIYVVVSAPEKYTGDEALNRGEGNLYSNFGTETMRASGFGIIPKRVMTDKRLSLKARGIYAYFCSFLGAGNCAFPPRDMILSDLQISEKTYQKHFRKLTALGYIVVKNRSVDGRFTYPDYFLNEFLEDDFKERMESSGQEEMEETAIRPEEITTPDGKNYYNGENLENTASTPDGKNYHNSENLENTTFVPDGNFYHNEKSESPDGNIYYSKSYHNNNINTNIFVEDNNNQGDTNNINTLDILNTKSIKDYLGKEAEVYSLVRKKIEEQIGYWGLVITCSYEAKRWIDRIVTTLESVYWRQDESITISGESYPTNYIKCRFANLDMDIVQLVAEMASQQDIRNPRAWLIKTLFEADIKLN